MKGALDALLHQGPSWMMERLVKKHPSNGLDVVLRMLQRTLPTTLQSSTCVFENVVYSGIRLIDREESYGSSSTTTKKYVEIEFISSTRSVMNWRLIIGQWGGSWLEDGYISDISDATPRNTELGQAVFGIIQDHREYPIWSTRRATITFLLCAQSLPLLPELTQIIAKMVWASRHDRSAWWPNITEADWDL